MENTQYGMITEQGDLGLGFNQVNEKETKAIAESVEKEKEARGLAE